MASRLLGARNEPRRQPQVLPPPDDIDLPLESVVDGKRSLGISCGEYNYTLYCLSTGRTSCP